MCAYICQLYNTAWTVHAPGVGRLSGVGDIHRQILQLLGDHVVSTSQNLTGQKFFLNIFNISNIMRI
jgi:hypothetical protein